MCPDARLRTFSVLLRICLDTSIGASTGAATALEDAIASLVAASTSDGFRNDIHEVMARTLQHVQDQDLHLRLVSMLPSFEPELAHLRQRLALSSLARCGRVTKQSGSLSTLSHIHEFLQEQTQFSIDPKTDFQALCTSVSLLDIGIGGGLRQDAQGQLLSDQDFNKGIDLIAQKLYEMFTSIRDTGRMNMHRTEAKQGLESLHARLIFGVRTKPQPKADLFGELPDGRSEAFLRKWMKPSKATDGTDDAN